MSTLTDKNQIAFLQGTWQAILQDQPEPFAKGLLADFVSNDVLASLPSRTTLKHVLHECRARDAFQESYIKSFLGLRKVWSTLTPESRHSIMQQSTQCGMHKQGGLRLQLLQDDAAALTIRWDVAQALYVAARDQAFRDCRALGLEMVQPRGRPRHNEFALLVQGGQDILLKLLRERVNTDKTAVVMAVGYVTPVAHTRLKHNLQQAYAECQGIFRAALIHWAMHHPAALGIDVAGSLTAEQENQLRRYVDECLHPLQQRFERLCQDTETMSSEPTLFEKVRRCFQDPVLH
ncbi:MAG TPA: hypothetical protein VLV87_03295 [Gammaproteobacteria bacterium]|nr:hypothetical protein [Gammaproteobacteria bacterium]